MFKVFMMLGLLATSCMAQAPTAPPTTSPPPPAAAPAPTSSSPSPISADQGPPPPSAASTNGFYIGATALAATFLAAVLA
ncbi:hypothetical protein GQ457_06G043690 [Hibiscus cannabinus]